MLQFFQKDNTYVATIESHGFESFKYGDVNKVKIEGNPETYINTLCYIYFEGKLIGSGIVGGYKHLKNENSAELYLYPMILDLQSDFCTNSEYNDDIADIIEDIINQYIASVGDPILYIKEKNATGVTVRHTFQNQSLLEAYNFIVNKFVWTNASVIVESDGGIVIRNTATSHNLTFGNDILKIEYEKDSSEIKNYIKFTNAKTWMDLIETTMSDTSSIAAYGKKVLFMSDSRFSYLSSIQEYLQNILDKKSKPSIKVENINTLRSDIKLFDKVSISNWEKNFEDDIYVNSITYNKDWMYSLDIGTKESRQEFAPE